jgi:hypothetical protein
MSDDGWRGRRRGVVGGVQSMRVDYYAGAMQAMSLTAKSTQQTRQPVKSLSTVLGSKSSEELVLLFQGLESAVTIFGGGVDELDVEWLQVGSLGRSDDTLAESDSSLTSTTNSSFDHQPILIDFTIVRESTNRGDRFLSKIHLSGAALVVTFLTNAHDSLVDLSTVMVTFLTSTCNSNADTSRMPSTNTSDLTKTTMSLSWKSGDTPTRHDTFSTVTTSSRANVKDLALREDSVNRDLLLEKVATEINLLLHGTTVELNLQQVGDLLAKFHLADLSVSKNTDHLAVLLDAVDLELNVLGLLGELLGVLGEGLSLGAVPILVESAFNFIRQVTSPNSGKRTKTIGGLDVTNKS